MDRRFRTEDTKDIFDRLKLVQSANDELLAWRARVQQPTFGDGPLEELNEIVKAWLKDMTKENKERIQFWHDRLNAAKISTWDEVPQEAE